MLILLSMSAVDLRPCMAAVHCSTHSQQRCHGLQQELTICILHAGNLGVWLGTFLYNMSCITPAILATLSAPPPPRTLAAVLRWAVTVANIVAGCLFVSGSYCTWQLRPNEQPAAAGAAARSLWRILGLPTLLHVRALQGPCIQSRIQRMSAAMGREYQCLSVWLALCSRSHCTCAAAGREGCLLQAVQMQPFLNICGPAPFFNLQYLLPLAFHI